VGSAGWPGACWAGQQALGDCSAKGLAGWSGGLALVHERVWRVVPCEGVSSGGRFRAAVQCGVVSVATGCSGEYARESAR